MAKQRDIDFDLLRSLIIISAAIIHCDSTLNLGLFSMPSRRIQHYIVTVGAFFFFTAGFMARRVYLPRFRQDAAAVSRRVFAKGLRILLIYLGYVAVMHVLTATPLPDSLTGFLYHHAFYTKVLFTFGLLFMVTPLILAIVARAPKVAAVLTLLGAVIVWAYRPDWPMPEFIRITFLDRADFLYPLLPSLLPYAVGFIVAGHDKLTPSRLPLAVGAVIVLGLFAYVFVARRWPAFNHLVASRQNFTFIEAFTPWLLIIAAKAFTSHDGIRRRLAAPDILCMGIGSLDFYVISNLLLGLVTVSPASPMWLRLTGTACILTLAYTATRWHFRAAYDPATLARRL